MTKTDICDKATYLKTIAYWFLPLSVEAQYPFQPYQSIWGAAWNETYLVSQERAMTYLVEG